MHNNTNAIKVWRYFWRTLPINKAYFDRIIIGGDRCILYLSVYILCGQIQYPIINIASSVHESPKHLKMKNENIFVRDIDWEVNFVLSSKYMSVLDEALVTIHLSNKE